MPLLIGVAGISGSGKSSICKGIEGRFDGVTVVSQDCFYKGLPALSTSEDYNFDSVDALDIHAIVEFLERCKSTNSRKIKIPQYDFVKHARVGYRNIELSGVIIIEGHLIFTLPETRSLLDKLVYIDVEMDIALIRRIRRDVALRGRNVNEILLAYERFVRDSALKSIALKDDCDFLLKNEDYSDTLDRVSEWFSRFVYLEA